MATKSDAPQPHKTISCQQLLQDGVSHSGWLRKRSKLHKSIKFVVKVLPWSNNYTALSKGCMYIFDSDTAKKPCAAYSLFSYNSVLRAGEILHHDAPWAFKLETLNHDQKRIQYFSASSEREQKVWMSAIKKQMMFANGKGSRISNKSISVSDGEVTFGHIEEDVYNTPPDLRNFDNSYLDDDDDDDDDYTQIPDPDEDGFNEFSPPCRDSRPLPPLPPGTSPLQHSNSSSQVSPPNRPPKTKRNRDPPPTPDPKSPSSAFSPGFRMPAPIPDTKHNGSGKGPVPLPNTRTPPDIPVHLPKDDSEEEDNTNAIPSNSHFPRGQNSFNNVMAGTVDELKLKFTDKPIVGLKPLVNKKIGRQVMPDTTNTSKSSAPQQRMPVSSVPKIMKGRSIDDRPPPPLPSSMRSSPEGADNKEEDALKGILWTNPQKEEANRFLNDRKEEGVFLIRWGEENSQVLVVYAEGTARKYRIVCNEGLFYITSEQQFDSIKEMLDYYYYETLPKRSTCLTKPYSEH